jgi:hypothetical protein
MPSTASEFALQDRIQAASLAALYNPLDLDLIHIATIGNDTVVKVSYTGVVTLLPATHSQGNLFGRFLAPTTDLTKTIAQYFALAWPTNPQQSDILQLISPTGGSIVWHLDYLGVSYTP